MPSVFSAMVGSASAASSCAGADLPARRTAPRSKSSTGLRRRCELMIELGLLCKGESNDSRERLRRANLRNLQAKTEGPTRPDRAIACWRLSTSDGGFAAADHRRDAANARENGGMGAWGHRVLCLCRTSRQAAVAKMRLPWETPPGGDTKAGIGSWYCQLKSRTSFPERVSREAHLAMSSHLPMISRLAGCCTLEFECSPGQFTGGNHPI